MALPTLSAGRSYRAKSGELFLTLTTEVATFDANYVLYSIADAADGTAGTLTIEIEEY